MGHLVKRANYGCGSVQPAGWDHIDRHDHGQRFVLMDGSQVMVWDRRTDDHYDLDGYDCIVLNHVLSDIDHHHLVGFLMDIHSILKHGGVVRILVPNVAAAFRAWERGQGDWFPQDERTGDINAKFCTFVTWFGESKSVFTYDYLASLIEQAGFENWSAPLICGVTRFDPDRRLGITELDDRCTEALIVEAVR